MCKVNILELEIRDVKLISKVSLKKVNIDCIAQGVQTQCIHYSIRLFQSETFPISSIVDFILNVGERAVVAKSFSVYVGICSVAIVICRQTNCH